MFWGMWWWCRMVFFVLVIVLSDLGWLFTWNYRGEHNRNNLAIWSFETAKQDQLYLEAKYFPLIPPWFLCRYSRESVLDLMGSHKLGWFELKGFLCVLDVCGKEIVCGSEGFLGAFYIFGTSRYCSLWGAWKKNLHLMQKRELIFLLFVDTVILWKLLHMYYKVILVKVLACVVHFFIWNIFYVDLCIFKFIF